MESSFLETVLDDRPSLGCRFLLCAWQMLVQHLGPVSRTRALKANKHVSATVPRQRERKERNLWRVRGEKTKPNVGLQRRAVRERAYKLTWGQFWWRFLKQVGHKCPVEEQIGPKLISEKIGPNRTWFGFGPRGIVLTHTRPPVTPPSCFPLSPPPCEDCVHACLTREFCWSTCALAPVGTICALFASKREVSAVQTDL